MERAPYIVWFGLYAVSGVSKPIEAYSSRGAVAWYREYLLIGTQVSFGSNSKCSIIDGDDGWAVT